MAIRYPVVPNTITVHLGKPDENSNNVTVNKATKVLIFFISYSFFLLYKNYNMYLIKLID